MAVKQSNTKLLKLTSCTHFNYRTQVYNTPMSNNIEFFCYEDDLPLEIQLERNSYPAFELPISLPFKEYKII